MTNHPYYQGNSGIPLAVGVDLKKQASKQKNLPLKQRIKPKVRTSFFPAQMAHKCLLQACGVSSTPPQEINWVFKDSWQHRVVNPL